MAITCEIIQASASVCACVREDLPQAGPGRGDLFLAWTQSCGTGYLLRVKVAGLSGDHIEGARLRQRHGAWRSGDRGAKLLAAALRAADADERHLLARLHQPVRLRRTRAAQARALGDERGGVAGQAVVRSQVSSSSKVRAHRRLERQKRRHRPVKRSSRSQSDPRRCAGSHQTTCCPFQAQLRSGASGGPAAELPRRASDEDVLAAGVQHPVVPFARVVEVTRHFYETLIEAQVVPDGVLPPLSVLSVVWKVVHDEFIDAVEREPSLGALADRHHDERVVTKRRFFDFHAFIGDSGFLAFAVADGSIQPRLCSSAFLWISLLGMRGGRTAALLQRCLSSPQQTVDAEGRLVEEPLRIFQMLHFVRQKVLKILTGAGGEDTQRVSEATTEMR